MIVYKFILQDEYSKLDELEFKLLPEQSSNIKLIDHFGYAVQECIKYNGASCTCGYLIKFEINEDIINPYLSIIDYGDFLIKIYDCPFDLDINSNLLSEIIVEHITSY